MKMQVTILWTVWSKNVSIVLIDIIKKHFNKELVVTKKDDENFENSTKCLICDNFIDDDVKVRDQSHITGKYRGSAQRDCNVNAKLNLKVLVIFQNLKNYDFHPLI